MVPLPRRRYSPRGSMRRHLAAFHAARAHLVLGAETRKEAETMRVFVAGANGAVGRRLVPMLVARGHHVTGTTTSEKSGQAIRAVGAEPVVVDGLDAVAIREAVARAEPDAIIHEMTALSGTPDFRHFDRWFALTNRLRTEGTENLLAAAKASGVKRFVAQSFTGWSNARSGG